MDKGAPDNSRQATPLRTRILLAVLHGLVGLFPGAFLFMHQCHRGCKWFEGIMPFVTGGVCAAVVVICRRYRWALLVTAGLLAFLYMVSRAYMNAIH